MRLLAIIPTVLLFIGWILCFVTLFIGTGTTSISQIHVGTINSPRVMQDILADSTLFFLNDTNPLIAFMSAIEPNDTAPQDVFVSKEGISKGVEPSPSQQLGGNATQFLQGFQALLPNGPIVKALPGFFQNATMGILNGTGQSFQLFLRNITTMVGYNMQVQMRLFLENVTAQYGEMTKIPPPGYGPGQPNPPRLAVRLPTYDSESALSSDLAVCLSTSNPLESRQNPILDSPMVQEGIIPIFQGILDGVSNGTTAGLAGVFGPNSTSPFAAPIQNMTQEAMLRFRSALNNDINILIESMMNGLGVYDYYDFNLLNYCFGKYDNVTEPGKIKKVQQGCANVASVRHFNLAEPLTRAMREGGQTVILPPIPVPKAVFNLIPTIELMTGGIFGLYLLAILFGFGAIVLSAMGIVNEDLVTVNILASIVSTVMILMVSAIVTSCVVALRSMMNSFHELLRVEFLMYDEFMGLTWGATSMGIVASFMWPLIAVLRWNTARKERVRRKSQGMVLVEKPAKGLEEGPQERIVEERGHGWAPRRSLADF
ncbi:hypothetical protein K402DRAFT_408708 [Aulographum hederae CBS 113979]|uniref:Integral membrane protein-like protein n=1 Tax=Aulographum hederae CBS 113979 TaxID=1176131 RepID=A0A6G1GK49_9PEZI|nr:hypothetical protein K402DRAFT_408708 [Aulographum hederae CBS 113979]